LNRQAMPALPPVPPRNFPAWTEPGDERLTRDFTSARDKRSTYVLTQRGVLAVSTFAPPDTVTGTGESRDSPVEKAGGEQVERFNIS